MKMKKSILFLLLSVVPALSFADDNDTLVIKKPQSVTVITGDSIQEILVKGKEGDDGFVYRDKIRLHDSNFTRETTNNSDGIIPKVAISKDGKSKCTAHLAIGWTAPTNVTSGVDFKTFRSWEIYFSPLSFEFYLNKQKRDFLTVGLGFDWRNYRMTGDTRFVKTPDEHVALGTYPEKASSKFSRIKVFSLCFPILYQHNFCKDWGFGIGPVINWNTYASLRTEYKMDGGEHSYVDKHIGQQKITVDFMLLFNNPVIDLYMKYSPMDVLKDSDVNFRSLSFGLYI